MSFEDVFGSLGKVPEEVAKQGRAADKADRERADLFEGMMKTEAWKQYSALIDAQVQKLADQIQGPAGSVDGMVALEYQKGTMRGLLVAQGLPQYTITVAKQINPTPDTDANS